MSIEAEVKDNVLELANDYKDNGFLLFSMGLKFNTMDYEKLYQDNVIDKITDKKKIDDKKTDFFYLDRESGIVTIAQSYYNRNWNKTEAPANKASDLNTAVNWLFDSDISAIPEASIKAQATILRDALEEKVIHTVEVWCVHNRPSSGKIKSELDVVAKSLQEKLRKWQGPSGMPIKAVADELSLDIACLWYERKTNIIAISDVVILSSETKPQEVSSSEWKAIISTLKGDELVALAQKFGNKLYAANVRDYLGAKSTARSINIQIGKTASNDPNEFWVFNNGITLLTNNFSFRGNRIKCTGIAVINGAQTIGSLAESSQNKSLGNIKVLARIVKANNNNLILEIIRYNNTQNPIKAWELRVNDPIQDKIQREFRTHYNLSYQLRRGAIRRSSLNINFEKLTPWLSSFYGDPITAYQDPSELYDLDSRYSALFNISTKVENLLFIYRLGETMALVKDEYKEAVANDIADDNGKKISGFFQYPSFNHVLMHICAEALQYILNPPGKDFKYKITLSSETLKDASKSKNELKKLVEVVLPPIAVHLDSAGAYSVFKTKKGVDYLTDKVTMSLQQLQKMNNNVFDELKGLLLFA